MQNHGNGECVTVSGKQAQAAFLSSPGHRRNIMNAASTKAGVGVAVDEKGYVYLTQIFVR